MGTVVRLVGGCLLLVLVIASYLGQRFIPVVLTHGWGRPVMVGVSAACLSAGVWLVATAIAPDTTDDDAHDEAGWP